jgi:hypothetical protein
VEIVIELNARDCTLDLKFARNLIVGGGSQFSGDAILARDRDRQGDAQQNARDDDSIALRDCVSADPHNLTILSLANLGLANPGLANYSEPCPGWAGRLLLARRTCCGGFANSPGGLK